MLNKLAKKLIDGKMLKPTPSVSVEVKIVESEDLTIFTITTCESCASKLSESL